MRNRLSATWPAGAATAIALALSPQAGAAQERVTDPTTLDILNVLVEKGVLSRTDADAVLGEARKRAESREQVVRAPYVPEAVRDQIREELRNEVIATARTEGWAQPGSPRPRWLDSIEFTGDVLVRAENVAFQNSNDVLLPDTNRINADGEYTTLETTPVLNVTNNRFRTRVRARFGADIRISDHVTAGVRFSTGNLDDPTLPLQTLSGNFGRFQVGFDRAYIKLAPFDTGALRDSRLVLGKFDNPFLSTEAIFDRELQFEGAAGTFAYRMGDTPEAPSFFLTAGAFPLEEYDFTPRDKYLFAGQLGAGAELADGFRVKAAAAIYHYQGVQGKLNTQDTRDNDYTAPARVQFGNTTFNIRRDAGAVNTLRYGLASDFTVAAFYGKAEFDVNDKLVASLEFEGARNLGFDRDDLNDRDFASSGGTLLHARARIGHGEMDKAAAWDFTAGYRRIEADSTLDLFTDSDFGLGGTDQKGFVITGSWAPFDRTLLTGRWLSARTFDLVRNGFEAPSIDTDTVQLDLAVKF